MSERLVSALVGYGFLEGAARDRARIWKDDVREIGWPAIFEESHRTFAVDPVELANCGVGQLLERLRGFLSAQGVRLGEVIDDFGPDGYSVETKDAVQRMFDGNDVEREKQGQTGRLARLTALRTIEFVNRALRRMNSPERLYAIGQPPTKVIFLTAEMLELIIEHPEAWSDDCPYSPLEE